MIMAKRLTLILTWKWRIRHLYRDILMNFQNRIDPRAYTRTAYKF